LFVSLLLLFGSSFAGDNDIRIPLTRAQFHDLCADEAKQIQTALADFKKKHEGVAVECIEVRATTFISE
jgi:hypothetical protein